MQDVNSLCINDIKRLWAKQLIRLFTSRIFRVSDGLICSVNLQKEDRY